MTKKEIRQAAQKEFAYQLEIGSKAPLEVREGFIKGAEWMQERMIEKAADWFQDYLFDVGYPDDWLRDSRVLVSGRDRFIKAMQDESK